MTIKNFIEYINEDVKIPTLDILIGDDGKVYNTDTNRLKGNIVLKKMPSGEFGDNGKPLIRNTIVDIIGDDRKSYPAGIDKNGALVGVNVVNNILYTNFKDKNRVDFPVKVPDNLIAKYGNQWRTDIDYIKLVPMLPSGWVNVKIDMEVLKRVKRYAAPLGKKSLRGIQSFYSKIRDLERMSAGLKSRDRVRDTIQKEMSVVILLHYINEIKDFFTPGSSGFLFESFIAGMIPNAKVVDNNGNADVIADDVKYQVKLYGGIASKVPMKKGFLESDINFYIIGLKYADRIDVYILSNDPKSTDYYKDFAVSEGLSVSKITKSTKEEVERFSIDLIDIEGKINAISTELKKSLDDLFLELSDFQYNVETIISGVNRDGEIIDGVEFTEICSRSKDNVRRMESKLDSLITNIDIKWEK